MRKVKMKRRKKKMLKKVLLIDGDILAYRIATANEQSTDWGNGLWTLHCDENKCKVDLDNHIDDLGSNLEADDVMGIMATEPHPTEDRIIVSIDKDMKQIPAKVCRDGEHIEDIPERLANYWFMIQTLAGDSTDGYTGIPNIGVKTAEKLIRKYTNVPLLELWKVVKGIYKEKGFSAKEALQQARVAHILRHKEYNKKTGKVKLWRIQ